MDKVEDIVGRLRWDSTYCRDRIGDTIRRIGRDCSEAADLIQYQQALIEEMREVLKPFAFQGLRTDIERFDDETKIEVHFPRASTRKATPVAWVYVEDVLKARKALSQKE